MEMEDITYPLLCGSLTKTLICVNGFIQIELNTNLIDGEKLENDEILNKYLNALVEANVLLPHGIDNPNKIISIDRLHSLVECKTVIVLDISSNVQNGVEHLACHVRDVKNRSSDDAFSSEDSSSWIQQVPDIPSGPTLRWNSEMTTRLIQIRGDMDCEFGKAKYKFRLWEKVAAKLNLLLNNVRVTAKDCDDKWRNIVATYRKNIEKLKFSSDNNIRWEYFDAMDNILKGTKDLLTPDHFIRDNSSVPMMPNNINTEVELVTEPFEIINVSADPLCGEDNGISDKDELLNSVITRTADGGKRTWTPDQCLMLIFLRHQMDNKFNECNENPHLWLQFAFRMNEIFLSDFTSIELETTWNYFNTQYELNLEKLKSKGVNTIKWMYFAVMDEIRGGTREISDICVPRPGEDLVQEFRKLQQKKCIGIPETKVSHSTFSRFNSSTLWDKGESDSDDNTFSPSSGILWTKEMIKALISWKKSMEQDIFKNRISKRKQWLHIMRKFRNERNVIVTEEACEEKWRYLVKMYKKNLIKFRKRENSIILWPYFWKMREILGNSVLQRERTVTVAEIDNVTTSNDIPSHHRVRSLCGSQNDTLFELKGEVQNGGVENQFEKLVALVDELRDNQNKMLKEIIEVQRRKIEDIQVEQRNIKALLLQLLQKYP